MLWYTLFIFLSTFIIENSCAKILVVAPTPSLSHQVIFHPLNKELVRVGHKVTFVTTNPAYPRNDGPVNLTEIDLGPMSYAIWKKEFTLSEFGKENFIYKGVKAIVEVTPMIFEAQMQDEQVKKLLKMNNFDLIMLEAWFRPAIVLSKIYKVPTIKVSSLGMGFDNPETIGAPTHPLLYSDYFHQRIYNLTITEQFTELYKRYYVESVFSNNEKREDDILRKNFGDVPLLSDMRKSTDLMFLNIMHTMWDRNRPVPKSVVYVGNIHQKPKKKLPKDIKSILDSSENGAIYISFGTNVPPSKLPTRVINIFVKVFSELPYEVLWKWDADELPGQTKNIKISKWFPQSDIFRHPKLKLVITQGGLQTIEEAVSNVIPMIGIPFLVDQWMNVENIVQLGIGKGLDIDIITEQQFREAILDVFENQRYRDNIIRFRSLVTDQRLSSLELSVWWSQHVLRHGAAHLRSPAAGLTLYEYHEISLLTTLSTFVFIIIILIAFTVYCVIRTLLNLFVRFKVKKT